MSAPCRGLPGFSTSYLTLKTPITSPIRKAYSQKGLTNSSKVTVMVSGFRRSPITAQDEKMLSKLSSAPRFPRTIRRNKEEGHVHGTEMRFRIYGRVRPDSRGQAGQALTRARHLVHKTERRARGRKHQSKFFSSQCGQKSLSECVCPLTGMVGQGRKHP